MAVRLSALRTGRSLHYFSASGTHFCYRSKLQCLVRLEGLGKLKELIHLNGSQHSASTTTLPRTPPPPCETDIHFCQQHNCLLIVIQLCIRKEWSI
jgi:hypothetical protein